MALPHVWSWVPPNATSLAHDVLNGSELIWLYFVLEITFHWAPVSSLNAVFCRLSIIVASQSLDLEPAGIIPINMLSDLSELLHSMA